MYQPDPNFAETAMPGQPTNIHVPQVTNAMAKVQTDHAMEEYQERTRAARRGILIVLGFWAVVGAAYFVARHYHLI